MHFKPLDLGVAVRIGLGLALRSPPLAGVAIGKFNRGADQSSGSGGFLLLKFSCLENFDLISLQVQVWDLSGFIRIDPIVKSSKNTQTSTAKIYLFRCSDRPQHKAHLGTYPGKLGEAGVSTVLGHPRSAKIVLCVCVCVVLLYR